MKKKKLIEIQIVHLIREPRTSYFTGFSGKIAISYLNILLNFLNKVKINGG